MSTIKIFLATGILLSVISAIAFASQAERTESDAGVVVQETTKAESKADGSAMKKQPMEKANMELGNFSVSLAVKDIKASKEFYEKLGFKHLQGKVAQNFVIMQNGTATIGLFQGMFDKNIMTFNPGWDRNAKPLEKFDDVRDLQAMLMKRGVKPMKAADEAGNGPASFVVVDPDGNQILVDQHVAKPK